MNMKKHLSRIALGALLSTALIATSQPSVHADSYQTVTYQQYNWTQWYFWYTQPVQNNNNVPQTHVEQPAPEVQQPAPAAPKAPAAQPASSVETQPSTSGMSAVELEVVKLVNQERAKYGLAPLKASAELSVVARDKSIDMRDRNYFDHQSPSYGSPFDMMTAYGIHYRTAGENIAAGQRDAQEVVTAWMNSEGHRKNILNPDFTTIGVGYAAGGSYQHYWTQHFTG